jgi:hypothetical protein
VIGKRFDVGNKGYLTEDEKKKAQEALKTGF